MIELVMYGMMPEPEDRHAPERAAGEQVDERQEPGLTLRAASCRWSSEMSTTGTGTCDPNR